MATNAQISSGVGAQVSPSQAFPENSAPETTWRPSEEQSPLPPHAYEIGEDGHWTKGAGVGPLESAHDYPGPQFSEKKVFSETVRGYANQTRDYFRQAGVKLTNTVRHNPTEALAIAVAIGASLGVFTSKKNT